MATRSTVVHRAEDTDDLIEKMEPPSMFAKMLPKMMKMVPPLMLMGIMVLLVGLGLGIYGADLVGDGIGTAPGEGSFADMKDAQVLSAWLQPFLFLGMGPGPATTLIVTAPSVSIVSYFMLRKDTGHRPPLLLMAATFVVGILVGLGVETALAFYG
jgi:hypothetical protein